MGGLHTFDKAKKDMKKANFLLVDDQTLIRDGVRALLQKEPFVENLYEAAGAKQFHAVMETYKIDIVLLDIKLPGVGGLELLQDLNARPNRPRIIVVTGMEGVELAINLLKLGVQAIVQKLDGYEEIRKAILSVMDQGHYFQESLLRVIQNNSSQFLEVPPVTLSYQERELLTLIAAGLTTKAIASRLKMTDATTETYRTRLIKKLGVPNTAALLAYSYRNGIL